MSAGGGGGGGGGDTVGSLLANLAGSLQDGLRILMFAEKRGWAADEFEQVRALEEALDEAKRDFQDMSPLVNGQFYYENDRRSESLDELRVLGTKFALHAQTFKDWLRTGGPINPMWARDTMQLRRELHRAQCRAAQRIFQADQETNARCLGAFLVYRKQREQEAQKKRERESREQLPQWQQQQMRDQEQARLEAGNRLEGVENTRRTSLEALVPDCNAVGTFQRFGERDIAFVCDFCDGHIVWQDTLSMPAARTTPTPQVDTGYPNWQASANSMSTTEAKTIVFAPLAIANHLAPVNGGWEARLWCPFCDEYTYYNHEDDEQTKYAQEDGGFDDLALFQAHLEWNHTALPMPSLPKSTNNCRVM